jgi:hypothetical protein
MKLKKTTIIFLFVTSSVHAQESINSSGAQLIGMEGSVSFSVGQPFYRLEAGALGTILQGVQQPYRLSIDPPLNDPFQVAIYPNPTNDYIAVDSKISAKNDLTYGLFDESGKNLEQGKIQKQITLLSFQSYAMGCYYLEIGDSELRQTFKIIKF